MSFIKRWAFVPLGLGLFVAFIMFAGWFSEHHEAKSRPSWFPNGDPLIGLNHHNVLICALFSSETHPRDTPLKAVVHFMGGGGGQQLKLYPSMRGVCSELDLTQFGWTPVMVMILPEGKVDDYTGFTATYWEPTNKPDPAPAYDWATVALTEREERWWIQFTFRSASNPMTTVTVGVE